MTGLLKKIQQYAGEDIRYPAACFSFVFSLWASFYTGIINLDGILYMKMASQMLQGQWHEALASYHLSFFPLLIMLLSKVTGLGLETCAYTLIACFSALLTYSFISILALFTTSRRVLFFGALVIVFHPEVMEAKNQILRDHGFWAFYMFGLYHFLRFYQRPSWKNGVFWAVWMSISFLFRFEGLVLLGGLPFILLMKFDWSLKQRGLAFLQANVVSLGAGCLLFSFVVARGGFSFFLEKIAHPMGYFNSLIEELTSGIAIKVDVVAQSILSHYADEFALPIVLLVPFVIIGGKLLGGLTPLYVVLLGWWRWLKKKGEFPQGAAVLVWAGLLYSCIYLLFTYAMFFIQGRYVIPLVLLLLLLVPFVFEALVVSWPSVSRLSLKKVGLGLVAVLLLVNFLEGVISTSDSKRYIKDAGVWLSENIDSEASLFSNNGKVVYYSGRFPKREEGRFALDDEWFLQPPSRAYYALWLKKRNVPSYDTVISQFGPPLKEFTSEKNHKVLIYRAPFVAQPALGHQ